MASPPITETVTSSAVGTVRWTHRVLALLILAGCAWSAWTFPVDRTWLLWGIGIYLLVLLRFPHAWLVVLPAAIPVLDLAYWSGRFFFNEFDLLVLLTLAWGLWQPVGNTPRLERRVKTVMVLLLVVQVPITLNGLFPLQAPSPGAWTDYFASTNALREGKGILWAILLMPMLASAQNAESDARRLLCAGMLAGLALAIGTIVWERLLFTGLFDLRSAYRVSGWFSGMHTGGAAIDSYLALASPFVASAFLLWDDRRVHLFGMALGLAAMYALYVTYSRANYPAVAVMALVFVFGFGAAMLRQELRKFTGKAPLFVVIPLVLIGLGIAGGENIQARFSTSVEDLQTRLAHWSKTTSIVSDTPSALLIGLGKGTFARSYFWDQQLSGEDLAYAVFLHDGDEAFIRFSKSDKEGNLFLRQRFDVEAGGERLQLTLRAPHGEPERLLVEFCERHILKFLAECQWRGMNIPAGQTDWGTFNVPVALPKVRKSAWGIFARPFEVSIMNRGIKNGLDIGSAQIIGQDGRTLLLNAEFDSAWDNWFISYGNHLRWHIKNLAMYWFFEGGVLGLLAMTGLCVYVGVRLFRRAMKGDRFALITTSSLAGVVMIGLFDSVFDEPRIGFLTLFLGLAALQITRPLRRRGSLPADQRAIPTEGSF